MKTSLKILPFPLLLLITAVYAAPSNDRSQTELQILKEQAKGQQINETESKNIISALHETHTNLSQKSQDLTSIFLTRTEGHTTNIVLSNTSHLPPESTVILSGNGTAIKLTFTKSRILGLFSGDIGSSEFTQNISIESITAEEIYSISGNDIKYRIVVIK